MKTKRGVIGVLSGAAILGIGAAVITATGAQVSAQAAPQVPAPSDLLPASRKSVPESGQAGLAKEAQALRSQVYGLTQTKFRVPSYGELGWDRPLPLSDGAGLTGLTGLRYAVLAGGCFWCLEAVYELVPGVVDVVSGYIDGKGRRPTYYEVGTETTGYAEAVRIAYDPSVVSYETILEYFWKIHDPTTLNRQGYDVGTQYRSGIYYVGEDQKKAAALSMMGAQKVFRDRIVTSLKPAGDFWIAEEYHQDYYRLNPDAGYCQLVVAPKVEKAGFR